MSAGQHNMSPVAAFYALGEEPTPDGGPPAHVLHAGRDRTILRHLGPAHPAFSPTELPYFTTDPGTVVDHGTSIFFRDSAHEVVQAVRVVQRHEHDFSVLDLRVELITQADVELLHDGGR
jgi:hypothetical protein